MLAVVLPVSREHWNFSFFPHMLCNSIRVECLLFQPVQLHDDRIFDVRNTCAFDSAAQILLVAVFDDKSISDLLEHLSENHPFFQFIVSTSNNGITESTYSSRCELLLDTRPVRDQIKKRRRNSKNQEYPILDCWSNAGGNIQYLLPGYASIVEFSPSCPRNTCGHMERRQQKIYVYASQLFNGSFRMILDRLFTGGRAGCETANCKGTRWLKLSETGNKYCTRLLHFFRSTLIYFAPP